MFVPLDESFRDTAAMLAALRPRDINVCKIE